MKKQGFELIELMVVIVILGILAAVAVPKIFGMICASDMEKCIKKCKRENTSDGLVSFCIRESCKEI